VIIPIDDLDDPRLAPYRLVRDRDVRGHGDAFVAEGEVVLRVLATSRFPIVSLMLEQKRVAAVRDVISALADDTPVYVVPQAVMDGVVGFAIHRGVLALATRGAPLDPDTLLAAPLLLALVGLTNHDNVGGIFRNAAAFGIGGVLLDDLTCDPLYRKSVRVSVGGALVVPFARAGDGHALIARLVASDYDVVALTPAGEHTLESLPPVSKRAFILGTEGPGLPAELIAQARGVRIDMAAGFDSLNVAVTSGIALYAATTTRR